MPSTRPHLRTFLKAATALVIAPKAFAAPAPASLGFSSPSLDLQLSPDAPEFLSLNIDALGHAKRGPSILQSTPVLSGYTVTSSANRVDYTQGDAQVPTWSITLSDRTILLTSTYSASAQPLTLRFDFAKVHTTVLGLLNPEKALTLPALMHLPGQGSVRITTQTPGVALAYNSERRKTLATLAFPPATADQKTLTYTLEVAAIHPPLPGLVTDSRFDAFRRNWLNVLQLNPFLGQLSNNSASTSCAFCYYEYADVAALTPPLAPGLTALDVVRQTLDTVLAGETAYGLPHPGNFATAASDTFPSMLIAAASVVREGDSDSWLQGSYPGLRTWAESMLATDDTGNGLIKYAISGNSGIWPDGFPNRRPSNWWDTIGFGHEDAYANALAFRALNDMAFLATRAHQSADADRYQSAAAKLRDVYYKTFFNPQTGVLGGWRSADGQLHDFYFLWVNGIAIHYGLVPKPQANAIMDKLMLKMKQVGYTQFHMGLPGNLITVALPDYVHKDPDGHHGGGVRPDNADGFQNYENGGATGCFAFFTLAALYDLGRKGEADSILFPMLSEYDKGGFEGRGALGRSNDWRRWDGTPMGYEGFLVDNYYTLLAVPLRQSETPWRTVFRPRTNLS